jgi:signal transduction histidine kinase
MALRRRAWERPGRTAFGAALLYAALAAAWITGSTRVAATVSPSLPALEHAELWKGALFAVASGLFFGLVLYALLRRLRSANEDAASAQHALVRAERRALVGMMASAFAHDCNNLLTLLGAQIGELAEARIEGSEAEAEALHGDASATLQQLAGLMRRFSHAGRRGAIEALRPTDLVAEVSSVVRITLPYLHMRGRRLEYAPAARRIGLEADPGLVNQALVNLVLNAADVARRMVVRVGAEAGAAWVEVEDDGPGIPAEERVRVFESFYTTKPGGAGLGLASVRFAADAHGGKVEIHDGALGGARIRLVLPVSPPEHAPARRLDDPTPPPA